MTYTSFTNDFLKQFYGYTRPFHEVEGYHVKEEKDGSNTAFINALGVDPADISISVKSEYPRTQVLSITGKTKNELWGEEFSVNLSFYVRKPPIKKITKSFRSGLLILKLEYDKPVQSEVLIVEE